MVSDVSWPEEPCQEQAPNGKRIFIEILLSRLAR